MKDGIKFEDYAEVYDYDACIYGIIMGTDYEGDYVVLWKNGVMGKIPRDSLSVCNVEPTGKNHEYNVFALLDVIPSDYRKR